jgi:type III secretion system FlhB-like substrate exporter
MLVIGYDPPFKTWFALHYDDTNENAPPRVAIGYHPVEQEILRSDRPDAIIGPYPVADAEELVSKLVPELMGLETLEVQPMCTFCGQAPWQSNPACTNHPYDRLRYGE